MNGLPIDAKPIEILLVEDNENDVILTQEGFKLAKLKVNLHHVTNGQECLAFLRKQGRYVDAPTPDLILLDLNMPVMDGRELLEQIGADETLNHLPIVVLTASVEERDILKMYKLRCSSYIVKPVDFAQFVRVIQEMGNYWFTVVVLPQQTN
ncbi:MAG TPA: response regulator [Anaerolineae bacterium]|nr:response regulator [Anaerolineae bacterium]MCB0178016.1 response regulator [Anaerolineae bacterium]MCB0222692.1 response regulator [Anaerolineae bacterium]MCB9107043.1 response regulator [Anaerolineales bacterium]HRV91661.1 response regulator [Anaerolineae bacterium]